MSLVLFESVIYYCVSVINMRILLLIHSGLGLVAFSLGLIHLASASVSVSASALASTSWPRPRTLLAPLTSLSRPINPFYCRRDPYAPAGSLQGQSPNWCGQGWRPPEVESFLYTLYTKEGPNVNTFSVLLGFCCTCVYLCVLWPLRAGVRQPLFLVNGGGGGPPVPGSTNGAAENGGNIKLFCLNLADLWKAVTLVTCRYKATGTTDSQSL